MNNLTNLTKSWSKEEMKTLFEGRSAFPMKPYALLGAELGRTSEACRNKWRDTDWKAIGFDVDGNAQNKYVYKSEFTGKIINTFDKQHNAWQLRADAIADVFEKSVERLPKAPAIICKNSNKKQTNSPEDVGLLLSDLHVGHQHTLEETGGISEYSFDIFKKRMNNLQEAVVEIVDLHKKLYKLPKLHIFCAGDIVAGMNAAGAWSPLYIVSPIVDQMMDGADALKNMIYYWLGLFDEIHFYGVVGNHGRSAAVGIQKDHDNWDYVCYKFLETSFQNNPRVKFHIPKSWWIMEKIRNHNFLMIHGDYTNGGGGFASLKAIQTFEQKMSSIIKTTPDYVLAGHYHSAAEIATNCGRIIVNGSFIGGDVYSIRNVHAASKPEQKLFGIHEGHGITWSYNVQLDSPRGK